MTVAATAVTSPAGVKKALRRRYAVGERIQYGLPVCRRGRRYCVLNMGGTRARGARARRIPAYVDRRLLASPRFGRQSPLRPERRLPDDHGRVHASAWNAATISSRTG